MSVQLKTSIGDISIQLFTKETPLACLNFLKLCKIKYYNGHVIHTVEHDVLFQTGDPTGTGKGGDSIFGILGGKEKRFFQDEIVERIKFNQPGLVAMANAGKHTNGSQFFITFSAQDLDFLNGKYTIFGIVQAGDSFDTLDKINQVILDDKNRPYQDILIETTIVLEDPFDDPPNLIVPPSSPPLSQVVLNSHRIDPNESIPLATLESERHKREAEARALTLEMIGDLPSADVKPPENVLFVCKLNPATTDEDLELIFSRFGPIDKCEIIRDKKSGDSLQYAFIEFQQQEHCEEAYYKMENVLIDDRRIHVDFSQSVSKLYGGWRTGFSNAMPPKRMDDTMQLKAKHQVHSLESNKYKMVFDDHSRVESKHEKRSRSRSLERQGKETSHRYSRSRSRSRSRNMERDRDHDRDRYRGRDHGRDRHRVQDQDQDQDRNRNRDRDREYNRNSKLDTNFRSSTDHLHRSREQRH